MKTIREKRRAYVMPKVLDVIPSQWPVIAEGSPVSSGTGQNSKQDLFSSEEFDDNLWEN